MPGIRRQKLFSGQHMCIFQKDHPRLSRNPSLRRLPGRAARLHHRRRHRTSASDRRTFARGATAGQEHHRACADLHRGRDPRQEHQRGGDHAGAGRCRACPGARHATCKAADQAAGIRDRPILARTFRPRSRQSVAEVGGQRPIRRWQAARAEAKPPHAATSAVRRLPPARPAPGRNHIRAARTAGWPRSPSASRCRPASA